MTTNPKTLSTVLGIAQTLARDATRNGDVRTKASKDTEARMRRVASTLQHEGESTMGVDTLMRFNNHYAFRLEFENDSGWYYDDDED